MPRRLVTFCSRSNQNGAPNNVALAVSSQPTIIHVTSWHDNTAANKYNPNPRNWVGYGQRTIDEMSFAWVSLYYIDEAEYQQRTAARKKTNE